MNGMRGGVTDGGLDPHCSLYYDLVKRLSPKGKTEKENYYACT